MTGTAKTEEQEFQNIYGLDVVCIPTNLPVKRIDENDRLYKTKKGKLTAIVRSRYNEAGKIYLHATSPGLQDATLVIRTRF